ncbi:uncharacterized protein LOC124921844 [Impatiens glandulifera]|uniref:uncharacterized protein LOC124921844 n=1 Tax=Impatiens glandulifera TaxID=253017 RepID=UPI001FB0E3D2|nr:uncharacterized protein LOC124921844 [Impatiens glandulifera]
MDNNLCNSLSIMSSSIADAIMNNQRNFLHCPPSSSSPPFSQHPKSMEEEELRQTLAIAQMELEATRQKADEELRNKDNQLTHLKFLLSQANLEKQESSRTLHRLLSDKFILKQKIHHLQHQNQIQIHHGISDESGIGLDYIEDEQPRRKLDYNSSNANNNGFSDSDESIVSSPAEQDPMTRLVLDQPLPEKGKLLLAVMKAGPLLQTLMLAGPLPQWRHPPPPLDSYQIPPPPVVIPAPATNVNNNDERVKVMRKRELCGGSDFAQNKHPRFVL